MATFLSTIFALLLIIIPGSSFFLIINLLKQTNRSPRNIALSFFIFFLSIEVLFIFIRGMPIGGLLYNTVWTALHFLWLPSLFFYIRFLFSIKESYSRNDILHVIPAFTILLFTSGGLISSQLLPETVNENFQNIIIPIVLLLQVFFYLTAIFLVLIKSVKVSRNKTNRQKLNLAFQLCSICSVSYILIILNTFIEHDFYFFFLLTLCICILFFQFKYISDHSIFALDERRDSEKYQNTKLSEFLINLYAQKIEAVMKNEKLFTEQNITIEKLGNHIKIHPHYVSQVINSKFGLNFFNYINSYRLKFAKDLICKYSNNHKTMLEIAFESGFNSKSTFYSYFKKTEGITPGDFLKTVQR